MVCRVRRKRRRAPGSAQERRSKNVVVIDNITDIVVNPFDDPGQSGTPRTLLSTASRLCGRYISKRAFRRRVTVRLRTRVAARDQSEMLGEDRERRNQDPLRRLRPGVWLKGELVESRHFSN
jgi:hypothetical protein